MPPPLKQAWGLTAYRTQRCCGTTLRCLCSQRPLLLRPDVTVKHRADDGRPPHDDKETSLTHHKAVVPMASTVLCQTQLLIKSVTRRCCHRRRIVVVSAPAANRCSPLAMAFSLSLCDWGVLTGWVATQHLHNL